MFSTLPNTNFNLNYLYMDLTHSHTMTDASGKEAFKTLREKETMLVTSIFSFSHSFLLYHRQILSFMLFILSSANALSLDKVKFLSSGNGLRFCSSLLHGCIFYSSSSNQKNSLSERSKVDMALSGRYDRISVSARRGCWLLSIVARDIKYVIIFRELPPFMIYPDV